MGKEAGTGFCLGADEYTVSGVAECYPNVYCVLLGK